MSNYNVGIYVRLSQDDERAGESVSIENQKLLLQRYVREQGWSEIDVYCDDGYSGTNFNRPGVKRLIEDVKSKRINVVLCKDLSRFGRNYIEIGYYTDYVFPENGCRFIALNNGVDTMTESSNNEVMGFLNLFNEFYCRDTSKKVKAVIKNCMEHGKFVGTYAPYGYMKDPENKHHLIIDDETAPTVKKIFELRSQGKGFRAITRMLNEEGIITPNDLYYYKKGVTNRAKSRWIEDTVKCILRNEAYVGNMVQGKTGTMSYKNKKLIHKPQDQWIRVEGTHEPIVTPELWQLVREMDAKQIKRRPPKSRLPSIFAGLIYCADCGVRLTVRRDKSVKKNGEVKEYPYFTCCKYSKYGKTVCTPHRVNERALTELVRTDIREKALMVSHDEELIRERILNEKNRENRSKLSFYEKELRIQIARNRELELLMQSLYEDKVKGTVSQEIFDMLMLKYDKERADKAQSIPELEEKIRRSIEQADEINGWLDIIKKYTCVEELNEVILFELVDRIEVHDAVVVDGKRVCNIKIFYRYVGNVDASMEEMCDEQAV